MIEFHIDPPGEQLRRYYNDRSRISLIRGPLGSGKTMTSIQKMLKISIEQEANQDGIRPTMWVCIRNTMSDLISTTIADFRGLLKGIIIESRTLPHAEDIIKFRLGDGTVVHMQVRYISLDRPDSIKKLRGTQVTGFWLNETKELYKPIVDLADLRHGRFPSLARGGVEPTWHGMIGDYNSPDEEHYLYKLAEETKPEGWAFFHQPGGLILNIEGKWVINPLAENIKNLPEKEDYYVKGQEGKSEDWIRVELANLYGFVKTGKPVHPQYNDSFHCKEFNPLPTAFIHIGMDFGLTPAAVFGFNDGTGRRLIHSEIVCDNAGAIRFAELIKEHIAKLYPNNPVGTITGDPAGDSRVQTDEKTVFQVLKGCGVVAKPAHTNDVGLRLEAVNLPLTRIYDGLPAFQIDPRCRVLRKALGGRYEYRRVQVTGTERYVDKPDKNEYSHVSDALQYLMLGMGVGKLVLRGKQSKKRRNIIADTSYNPFD